MSPKKISPTCPKQIWKSVHTGNSLYKNKPKSVVFCGNAMSIVVRANRKRILPCPHTVNCGGPWKYGRVAGTMKIGTSKPISILLVAHWQIEPQRIILFTAVALNAEQGKSDCPRSHRRGQQHNRSPYPFLLKSYPGNTTPKQRTQTQNTLGDRPCSRLSVNSPKSLAGT